MVAITTGFGESDIANAKQRLARNLSKTQTFDGTANNGAIGAVPLFTVTGTILIERIVPFCTVDLAGATATLALGVTGATALLIAATTATGIDLGMFWVDASPDLGGVAIPSGLQNIAVGANIIGTVATAAITAGVIRFDVLWRPISPDGNLT